jgi:hypothetical protein
MSNISIPDLRYLLQNNIHHLSKYAYKQYDEDFDSEYPPFSAPYPRRLTLKEFEAKILSDDEFNKRYGDVSLAKQLKSK